MGISLFWKTLSTEELSFSIIIVMSEEEGEISRIHTGKTKYISLSCDIRTLLTRLGQNFHPYRDIPRILRTTQSEGDRQFKIVCIRFVSSNGYVQDVLRR
jgi:hypothetical protein